MRRARGRLQAGIRTALHAGWVALQQAESLTGGDPWLVAKLARIREVAEHDE